jgi:hypothetical protein
MPQGIARILPPRRTSLNSFVTVLLKIFIFIENSSQFVYNLSVVAMQPLFCGDISDGARDVLHRFARSAHQDHVSAYVLEFQRKYPVSAMFLRECGINGNEYACKKQSAQVQKNKIVGGSRFDARRF